MTEARELVHKSEGVSNFTRPQDTNDLVGLDDIKEIITNDIEGSKKLGEPISSFLLEGVSGCGKTTVAGIIANQLGGKLHSRIAGNIKKTSDLMDLAVQVSDGDVIIIEEAHDLNKKIQSQILIWIESFKLYDLDGGGSPVSVPKTSFVFPTTSAGRLSKPLVNRCKILHFSFYTTDQISEILVRAARKYDLDLTSDLEALRLLAQSSRSTPRIAVMNRLDGLRKFMAAKDLPYNADTVRRLMKIYKISSHGLESNDIRYINILYDKLLSGGGRPVSKQTLLQSTNLSDDTVEVMIEGYLLQQNIIAITHGGRIITEEGYRVLDLEPPQTDSAKILQQSTDVDMERLAVLVKNQEMRAGGMKRVAAELGLRYPQDIYMLKSALKKLGFDVRRRSGIIPME